MKVIYATDGSDDHETAAKTLIALGLPDDTEITVLSVVEPPQYLLTPRVPPPYHAEWLRAERDLRLASERAADRAIELSMEALRGSGVKTKPMIRTGQASEEIVQAAEETEADIVVVGSRGLTGVRLFLLGSVSQRVIEYAPCSVLVVKPVDGSGPIRIGKVLLATDGSEYACAAARFISAFRLEEDTDIVILHVQSTPRWLAWSSPEQLEQARQANAGRVIEDTLGCLMTRAKTTTVLRDGDPSEQVLSAGSEMEADLVVVGSRGLSGVKRFLLGSVSQKVCQHSNRSVLVVRERSS